MDSINIKATGFDTIEKILNNLAVNISNPDEKLMKRLGGVVLGDIDQRFMTRGRGTWAPLSPRTIKRKGHDYVLIDSGAMFKSVTITELSRGKVAVGVLYAGKKHDPKVPGYHQAGAPARNLPQRKIVENTPLLQLALITETQLWVKEMIVAFKTEVSK